MNWRGRFLEGVVIPACPLTLFADGSWSEDHQRAVIRYYLAAGAGGLAVAVHSTQFAIRHPNIGLFEPVLRLAQQVLAESKVSQESFVSIAGVCGPRDQAIAEATLAQELGYQAALLSLTALGNANDDALIEHCRIVGETLPIVGFYLQPAVGGRVLSYKFWRRLSELPSLVGIKIAPFNRYQTWDVVRAVIESGRDDIALYTGNDDNIVIDLLTQFEHQGRTRFIAGGLLGQWGVGTRAAVNMLQAIQKERLQSRFDSAWLTTAARLTDLNAAIFDPANMFAGCIPGIMEVLARSGLAPSKRCLDPNEVLSPGQQAEIDRVLTEHADLLDTMWIQENLRHWLG